MALYRVTLPYAESPGAAVRFATVEVEAESEPEAKRLAMVEFDEMAALSAQGARPAILEHEIKVERAPASRRTALEVTTTPLADGVVSARLVGSLTSGNFAEFQGALDELKRAGTSRLVLDLSALTYVNSTGLSLFVAAADLFDMRMAAVPARILRLLRLIGLAQLFPIYQSVSEAARAPGPAARG